MNDFIFEIDITDISLCDEIAEMQRKRIETYDFSNVDRYCGLCHHPIKYSKDTSWYFVVSEKHPWIKKLGDEVGRAYEAYQKAYPLFQLAREGHSYTDHPFNVQYYEPGQGYPLWHCEYTSTADRHNRARMTAWMLYLNDVPDGGTEFLYQEKTLEAKKGKMAIWPAYFTHQHRGVVSHTSEKIIATGWGFHG